MAILDQFQNILLFGLIVATMVLVIDDTPTYM
jgi:hypothetical protein